MALKPCLRCGRLSPGSYCPLHRVAGWTGRPSASSLDRPTPAQREKAKRRAGHRCERCGVTASEAASQRRPLQVHHRGPARTAGRTTYPTWSGDGYEEVEPDDVWDPRRLAAACDAVQDAGRRGIEIGNTNDPRVAYIESRILAGQYVLDEVIYSEGTDAASVIGVIDRLPAGALKALAFTVAYRVGVAREQADGE